MDTAPLGSPTDELFSLTLSGMYSPAAPAAVPFNPEAFLVTPTQLDFVYPMEEEGKEKEYTQMQSETTEPSLEELELRLEQLLTGTEEGETATTTLPWGRWLTVEETELEAELETELEARLAGQHVGPPTLVLEGETGTSHEESGDGGGWSAREESVDGGGWGSTGSPTPTEPATASGWPNPPLPVTDSWGANGFDEDGWDEDEDENKENKEVFVPEKDEDATGYLWRAPTTLELTAVADEEGEFEEWVWAGPTKAVRRTHPFNCGVPKTMEELAKMNSLELCRYTPTPRYLLPPIPRYHDGNSRPITSGLTDDTKDTPGDRVRDRRAAARLQRHFTHKNTADGMAAGGGGGTADNDDATRAAKRRRTD
jgi:hypothetical protein